MILKYDEFVSEKFDYSKQKEVIVDKNKPFDADFIKNELEKKLQIKPKTLSVYYDYNGWLNISMDYLDSKDWPYGIKDNSCYFNFYVYIDNGNVGHMKALKYPHCYISPYDKEHDFKYMAMRGVTDMGKEIGVAYRKFTPKSDEQIVKKLVDFINPVMKAIDVYTGGYPYHEGILKEPLKDAYKKA